MSTIFSNVGAIANSLNRDASKDLFSDELRQMRLDAKADVLRKALANPDSELTLVLKLRCLELAIASKQPDDSHDDLVLIARYFEDYILGKIASDG